jgi:methyl-accepting chemotaxis protein
VNKGSQIASQTAETLRMIVADAGKIADLIAGITVSSSEQTADIKKIAETLSQITDVVQNNLSTSEKTSTALRDLTEQSENLQNLISVFKMR